MKIKNPYNSCKLSSKQLKTIREKQKTQKQKQKIKVKSKTQVTKYIKQLFEKQKNKQSVIPLNIYQVWHSKTELPKSVKESIELVKKQNPEFTHYLFDEKECRDFLKKNFSKQILNTYDKMIPHALKADLWRYCFLYKNGGIYLDSKYYCMNGFKFILLTDKEYFCRDVDLSLGGIYNAILICKPKNKILLKAIKQVVKNVKNEYYGPAFHCPTGPGMLKSFFTQTQLDNLELTHEFVNDKLRFIKLDDYRILKYHENYTNEKTQKNNHWTIHWKNRTMYKNKTKKTNKTNKTKKNIKP
jgi:mannosyltransferase OCH1-like enzyme